MNLDYYEKALLKEQNEEINIHNKFKEISENEKYNKNRKNETIITNKDKNKDKDNLIENYQINQSNSLDFIKETPLFYKSFKEDFSNLTKVYLKLIYLIFY